MAEKFSQEESGGRLDFGFVVKVLVAFPVVLGGLAIITVLLSPSIKTPRDKAVMLANCNSMKNIALAMRNYSSDWDGKYPEKLDDLVPEYVDDNDVFLFQSGKKEQDGVRFLYLKGVTDDSPGNTPLVKSPFPVSKGKWLVAYKDGHVETVEENGN